MRRLKYAWCGFVFGCVIFAAGLAEAQTTVKQAMDDVVTRLYASMTEEQLYAIDDAAALKLFSPEEREVLATRYWTFNVDVPVIVSVLRETRQENVPFWLAEKGFTRTDMTVKNEEDWTYEVWQKEFPAGNVGLGINGFDKHREHYLVGVGAQEAGKAVTITNLIPAEFSIETLQPGAMCYHDWSSLKLTEVPESLVGHKLLTTIRGRARDAHLVNGFRKTQWPSSSTPDQIFLTWADDPKTTQAVQWRTNPETKSGAVQYKKKGAEGDWASVDATYVMTEDRLLANDRYCHHYTAKIGGLEPGTEYVYRVGGPDTWSEEKTFKTAPDGPEPFTFVMFGDTHNNPEWGKMLEGAFARHPETAFYTIAGDLVNTGQYRDDWDAWIAYSDMVFNQRPIMPSIGNHDTIDGLGAELYQTIFALPENAPPNIPKERAYSFEYSNAIVLVPDCTLSEEDQVEWMDEQLSKSNATWKFAVFHFPPYSRVGDYPGIQKLWGAVFDKHHLDFALEGHVHHYMRSKPIKNEKPVDSPAEGTIHLISIAIPGRGGQIREMDPGEYGAKRFRGGALYQTFKIDGNRLEFKSHFADGTVHDELVIEK